MHTNIFFIIWYTPTTLILNHHKTEILKPRIVDWINAKPHRIQQNFCLPARSFSTFPISFKHSKSTSGRNCITTNSSVETSCFVWNPHKQVKKAKQWFVTLRLEAPKVFETKGTKGPVVLLPRAILLVLWRKLLEALCSLLYVVCKFCFGTTIILVRPMSTCIKDSLKCSTVFKF